MDRVKLARGDKILYQDEIYSVIHIYESDYIEISKDKFKVELVHYSEIKKVD